MLNSWACARRAGDVCGGRELARVGDRKSEHEGKNESWQCGRLDSILRVLADALSRVGAVHVWPLGVTLRDRADVDHLGV